MERLPGGRHLLGNGQHARGMRYERRSARCHAQVAEGQMYITGDILRKLLLSIKHINNNDIDIVIQVLIQRSSPICFHYVFHLPSHHKRIRGQLLSAVGIVAREVKHSKRTQTY